MMPVLPRNVGLEGLSDYRVEQERQAHKAWRALEPGKERRIEGMRYMGILGVLCVFAAPTLGAPQLYTFNITAGSVILNVATQQSTSSGLAGTFSVNIGQSNGHIGQGDSFELIASNMINTQTMKLGLAGLATATLNPGAAKFLDFAMAPGVIGGNMVPNPAPTDVYLEATVLVTGLFTTTFATKTWANSILPFTASFTTSGRESDIVIAALGGTFGYAVGIPDIGMTLTLDLVVNVEGTAHVVPDPALGGLTALGLGGAGAWLRRRRS